MSLNRSSTLRQTIIITALIMAGEGVFLLPFVVARIFRPTFLTVFDLTNLELGAAFSLYGFVAMGSYFLGGPLADRFSARKLMGLALVATSVGGVVMASIPSLAMLTLLYGFWGLTTILLFWAALIKATRIWGGRGGQGRAYGILDGGRGLFAAVLASLSVAVFAAVLPTDPSTATGPQLSAALGRIIWIFSGLTFLLAAVVWVSVPEHEDVGEQVRAPKLSMDGVMQVVRMPLVWMQAVIVVCAYVGYKCTDNFSLYASDSFGYDDVAAAQIGTITFWVRPIAAVGAGFLGDRIMASKMVMVSFMVLILGSIAMALGLLEGGTYWILAMTIATTSVGIYALRGVYFALLQEARIPVLYTGSAVGLVSVLGFTPDIFMGPLMGFLIDRSPGALGHHHVFALTAAFGAVGLTTTILFYRKVRKQVFRQHR